MAWSRSLIPALALLLAHCDGTIAGDAGADGAVEATADDATPSDERPEPSDATSPETGADAPDGPAPLDQLPVDDQPDVTADDATDAEALPDLTQVDATERDASDPDVALDGPDDASDVVDAMLIEDIPALMDVATIDDAPAPDVATDAGDGGAPADAPATCTPGLTDDCPTTGPGPCAPLVSGVARAVRFSGLGATIPSSCEGSITRNGRDGLVPLVLSAPSDVTVTAQPGGGDLVVIALYRAIGCGIASGELRCTNGGTLGATARVSATSLEPGTYYVAVTSVLGNTVNVTATVTPARPRRRGDVCPGVPITPDAPPVTLSTSGFQTSADYGTTCGAGASSAAWVDSVFSYTLTSPRDVTVVVSATGSGDLALDVGTSCGARMAAVPPCQSGPSLRRVLRNQPAGTWYVTVDHRATSTARTLSASVITAPPTPTAPADRCPGVALSDGIEGSVDVSQIGGDATLACVRSQRADAYFSFIAPSADRDVLVNLRGAGTDGLGFALQSTCGEAIVGGCNGTAERAAADLWTRYRGLSPGAVYTISAGTAQTTGALTASYHSVPASTPTPVASANNSCNRAVTIPAEGGLFTGSNGGGDRVFSGLCRVTACLGGRAVYFRLSLAQRRRVVITTAGSGFDTVVNVLSGDCPGRGVDGACSDDVNGTAAQVDATLAAGSYVVMLAGCGAAAQGTYALDVAVLPP